MFRVKALGREVSSQTLLLPNLCKFMYYLKHEWSVLSRDGLALARGGVLFFMIKQKIIRDKMRYSNLSNNMMIISKL
jgi:hypothetical protein